MTQEQINKLPKWAQEEFRLLNMRLNEATAELTLIRENTESNTIVGWNKSNLHPNPKYLKNNQMITFITDNKSEFQVRVIDDKLQVHHSSSWYKDMYIKPQLSNSIFITAK